MAAIPAGSHARPRAVAPRSHHFDCDGVLVDSEPLALRVLIEGIAERRRHHRGGGRH